MAQAKVTIQSSQIPSNQTDIAIPIDLSDMPQSFWDTVSSDGSDIRVYLSDGATETARYIADIDTTNQSGLLWVKSGTLSSSSNTDLFIDVDGSRSGYANTDTFGRNAVFANGYQAAYTFANGTLVDVTGNGHDGTNTNTTVGSGYFTDGRNFDGDDYIDLGFLPATGSADRSVSVFAKPTGNYDTASLVQWGDNTTGGKWRFRLETDGGTGHVLRIEIAGSAHITSLAVTEDVWQYMGITFSGTTLGGHRIFANGNVEQASGSNSVNTGTAEDAEIGHSPQQPDDSGRYFIGDMEAVFISDTQRSDDWMSVEENSFDTASFYTTADVVTHTLSVDHVDATFITTTTNSIQKSLQYSVPTQSAISKSLQYEVETKFYTREALDNLPSDDTDLATDYSESEETDVASDDAVRVGLTAVGGQYAIHQYKMYHSDTSQKINISWDGQTNVAPSNHTVYLQVYNHSTGSWETIDSNSSASVGTDFTLSGSRTGSDYFNNNLVSVRVYQLKSI